MVFGILRYDFYRMPDGLGFTFFGCRSLNEAQEIQVDANQEGVGGVVPDLRVPMTEENGYAMYVQGKDIVLEAAIAELNSMNE